MERAALRAGASPERPAWRAPVAAALVAAAALAAALLLPRLFADPVSLDPHLLRLDGVALVLAATALLWAPLAEVRGLLLSIVAIAAGYSLFSGGPQLIVALSGTALGGDTRLLTASVAEAVLTAALAVAVLAVSPAGLRPDLRLRRFGRPGLLATAAGLGLFFAVVMALPATLLGREALQPVALARDLPLLAPACVAQALAQELQFRGLLLGLFDRVLPPAAANGAQALLFGLAHIAVLYEGPGVPFVPLTVLLGYALGWVTQRTASIWPAVIIHAVADVAVTVGVVSGLYGS